MRNIVAKAWSTIPEPICDFRRYRLLGYIDFNRFLDYVEADCKKGALAICSTYYGDIVRLVSQPRYLNDVSSKKLSSFLDCANNLLALQVVTRMTTALNTLKPTDIAVVKTMKSPPEAIKLVMAAVCVMLNVPPIRIEDPTTGKKVFDYWGPSKRVLGDMKFLESLRHYDKDNISPQIMDEIKRTYVSNKSYEPKIVARASSAAEGLCKWVRAMVLYDGVAKVVTPKRQKLQTAQRDYENTMAFLNERRRMN